MRNKLFLALCLFASPIYSEDVTLSVPTVSIPLPVVAPAPINPGDLLPIPVTGLTVEQAKLSQVIVYPREGVMLMPVCDWTGKLSILFQAKLPGKYLVAVFTADKATGGVNKTEVELVVGTPIPPPIPPPVPPPVPPPDPNPTPTKVKIIVVEESANSTQAFAQIRSSKKLRDWANAGGHLVFFLDQNAVDATGKTPASFKPWIDLAAGKPLPQVIIVDSAKNTVLAQVSSPTTEADFLALVERYGGKSPSVPSVVPSACQGGACGR